MGTQLFVDSNLSSVLIINSLNVHLLDLITFNQSGIENNRIPPIHVQQKHKENVTTSCVSCRNQENHRNTCRYRTQFRLP